MPRKQSRFVGRRAELESLWPAGRFPALRVVRGEPGSGRTALLGELRAALEDTGVVVLDVRYREGTTPDWDHFGVRTVLDAVRARYEQLDPGPGLSRTVGDLARLCTPQTYRSSLRRAELLEGFAVLARALAGGGRVAVLADDVDAVPGAVHLMLAARRAGHLVVATAAPPPTTGLEPAEPAELCAHADRVVELGPLSGAEVDALVRRAVHAPLDRSVADGLRAALGPLYGNPATVLATVAELRARERLVPVGDRLCLPGSGEPIALPARHPLLSAVGPPGTAAADVVVLAAGPVGLSLDEVPPLAAGRGRSEREYGTEIDRLVRAGILGDGDTPTVRCPALGVAVTAAAGPAAVRALHRMVATALAGSVSRTVHEDAVLADHVAAAGPDMPFSPALAALLYEQARVAALRPEVAARRYRAAWRHTAEPAERDALASLLVRLLVRSGRYEELADVAAEVAAGTDTTSDRPLPEGLAAGAALAALHLGRPLPGPLRGVFDGDDAALAFCDRWFAGDPLELDDLVAAFGEAALTWSEAEVGPPSRRGTGSEVGVALAFRAHSLIPACAWVFGSAYGAPTTGPQHALRGVARGYADGDWSASLSAARQLVLSGSEDPAGSELGILLAAEMTTRRDYDRRRTPSWLDALPARESFPALRGWVEAGAALVSGEAPADVLLAGWGAWRVADERDLIDAGGWMLLVRLAVVAVTHDERSWPPRLLAAAQALRERDRSPHAPGAFALVQGLCARDPQAARAGLEDARGRGHLPEIAVALLGPGLVDPDPAPWLQEARTIADDLGAAVLRSMVRSAMDRRGVSAESPRQRPDTFSDLELRIVEKIREGLTNRQIAEAARVSEKTVENHLTKLFVKVGCRTRHGLAAASLGGRLKGVGA